MIVFFFCSLSQQYAQSRFESKFISRVSQKHLQQTVRDLVKCGNRLGGTKSGDKATQLVFQRFKSYGFRPEIIEDPEELTYSNHSWQLEIEQPQRLHGLVQHEWLAGFSPSTPQDTAELTFVSSTYDIDAKRVGHKVVLLERSFCRNMYEDLVDAGAHCMLDYETTNSPAYSNWTMISSLKPIDKNPVPVFNIPNIVAQRLRKELERGTRIVIRYSARTTIAQGSPKTVIATLQGKTDDYYLVCAHGDSDSGGPGADDNASGVSGVLEVAHVLKMLVQNKIIPLPRQSIRFIVWGKEISSSSNYVKQHSNELGKICGVINIDEIGIGKARNCLYFEGNDIPHNHDLLRLFERIGEEYVDKKGFWKEATTNPSNGETDSYIFLPKYLRGLDVPEEIIPSITVFTAAWNELMSVPQTRGWFSKAWKGHPDSVIIDYSPYYHSSLDIPAFTTDKEPANMVWGVNAVGIALIRLLWE